MTIIVADIERCHDVATITLPRCFVVIRDMVEREPNHDAALV